jgi:hypothetical protein
MKYMGKLKRLRKETVRIEKLIEEAFEESVTGRQD